MDPATLIGIVLAFGALWLFDDHGGLQPHGHRAAAAAWSSSSAAPSARRSPAPTMADVKKIGGWFKQALLPAKVPPVTDRIATLVSLAEKARKEGLLALEAQVKDIDDPFLKRGLQMGIDGTDPEELRAVLEGEIAAKKAEDKVGAKFFTAMGGYAPDHRHHRHRRRPDPRAGEPRQARVARPADRRRVRRDPLGRAHAPTSSGCRWAPRSRGSASCRPPRWSCSSRASPRSRPAPARAPSARS